MEYLVPKVPAIVRSGFQTKLPDLSKRIIEYKLLGAAHSVGVDFEACLHDGIFAVFDDYYYDAFKQLMDEHPTRGKAIVSEVVRQLTPSVIEIVNQMIEDNI